MGDGGAGEEGISWKWRCLNGLLLSSAVFIIVVSLVVAFGLPEYVDYKINQQVIVDSVDSPGFKAWQNSCEEDVDMPMPPVYMSYTFWNLTNPEDVMFEGAKPDLEKVGPYVYRECKEKVNITFSDDGELVTYGTVYTYFWEEDRNDYSEDDLITSLNPVVLGLLSLVGSEYPLAATIMDPYLIAMSDYFTFVFPLLNLNTYSQYRLGTNRSAILQTEGIDEVAFEADWANGTSADLGASALWNGMYVAAFVGDGETPSGISAKSAALLWDADAPYSFMNPTYEAQMLWVNADRGRDTSALEEGNHLTPAEMGAVLEWRAGLRAMIFPDLRAYLNAHNSAENQVRTMEDLGALQWATCKSFFGQGTPRSVFDVAESVPTFPEELSLDQVLELFASAVERIPAIFPPEVWWWQEEAVGSHTESFTVNFYNTALSPLNEDSITSHFSNYGTVLYCLQDGDVGKGPFCRGLLRKWGLQNESVRQAFSQYLWENLYQAEASYAFQPCTSLGLYQTKSVRFWLWFGPTGIGGSNGTEVEDPNSTYYTGAGDSFARTAEILEWEGQSVLVGRREAGFWDGYWPLNVSVNGAGDGTQFPPGTLEPGDDVYVWNSDALRTIALSYNQTVEVQGLESYLYVGELSQLDVDPLFDQGVKGFGNLTHSSVVTTAPLINAYNLALETLYGALFDDLPTTFGFDPTRSNRTVLLPAFLSLADMYYADPYIVNTTIGQDQNAVTDLLFINVEPRTGATIVGRKILQYNVFLEKWKLNRVFNLFYKDLLDDSALGVMWPVAIINENGVISADIAESLQFSLYGTDAIAFYALVVGVPVGVVLLVGFFLNEVVMYKRRSVAPTKEGYSAIQ